MNAQSLWNLIKTTLIEKDGTTTVFGSIKRWSVWVFLGLIAAIVFTCLCPTFHFQFGTTTFDFNHDKYKIDDYLPTIKAFLATICVLLGIGGTLSTVQNYHELKYGDDTTTDEKK